jgi:hypothetical protein
MNTIDMLIAEAKQTIIRPNLTNELLDKALEDLAYKAKAQGIAEVGNQIQSLLGRELMKCVEDEI